MLNLCVLQGLHVGCQCVNHVKINRADAFQNSYNFSHGITNIDIIHYVVSMSLVKEICNQQPSQSSVAKLHPYQHNVL